MGTRKKITNNESNECRKAQNIPVWKGQDDTCPEEHPSAANPCPWVKDGLHKPCRSLPLQTLNRANLSALEFEHVSL